MNASGYEQELAQTDGVLLRHWLRPTRLLAEGGKLAGVELEYTRRGAHRQTLTLPCDQLFKAIGQAFLPADVDGVARAGRAGARPDQGRRRAPHLARRASGPAATASRAARTSPSSAVEDGKQAALSIDRHLTRRR